jgi:hypothetical protein
MPDEREEAREAARKASDPERLLPGESLDSPHIDDVEHWIAVYRELLAYKDRLLAVTRTTLSQPTEEHPARREIVETDQALIVAERERFVRRLGFWQDRLIELKTSE